tara:strand:+ start:309 stop:1709 length:1401 start_codon:yes stop_codon:yes gene_type:complete
MKKIFIFLLLPFSIYSQQLESFLSLASFNSDKGPFIETYLGFNANTIKLNRGSNNKFSGKVNIKIDVLYNDSNYYNDSYILTSPYFNDSIGNNLFFIDQQRILLSKNGQYNINITTSDTENDFIQTHESIVKFDYDTIAISDIQLIEDYKIADTNSILTKSGYSLSPFILNFYPSSISKMSFYFEVYNTQLLDNNNYLLSTYIEDFESQEIIKNYYKTFRMKTSFIESKILEFDISSLETGNYNLVCVLRNVNNKLITVKKVFFQRSNNVNLKNHSNIQQNNFDNFTRNINNKDSLKLYIDVLYPISSSDENSFARNQLEYDNIELMQNYLYDFWKKRNPKNPFLAWKEYYLEVKKVNTAYKNLRKKGYLTDRGRVYLQYGSPNTINSIVDASATYPYEIWHYYKLKNQTNKKFVFVNRNKATNEYRLEYSNVDGEVSNAEWIYKIEQNEIPTFGDDFNNNYINPK